MMFNEVNSEKAGVLGVILSHVTCMCAKNKKEHVMQVFSSIFEGHTPHFFWVNCCSRGLSVLIWTDHAKFSASRSQPCHSLFTHH